MKIRNGFVSNSSSSSFILKFDKMPESVNELKVMLYGENPPLLTTYWDDDAISTDQVSKIIFNDIESAYTLSLEEVISQVKKEVYFSEYSGSSGRDFVVGTEYINAFDALYRDVVKKDKDFNKLRWSSVKAEVPSWEEHQEEMDKMAKPLYDMIEKSIREKYTDGNYIEVEYSDNDGHVMSYIEHSDVLKPVMFQRFSHH